VETWNIVIHLSLWLSVLCYFCTVLMENFWLGFFPDQYGVVGWMFVQPTFWLWCFACILLCMLPDITLKFIRREFRPAYYQLLQEYYRHRSTAFYHPLLGGVECDDGHLTDDNRADSSAHHEDSSSSSSSASTSLSKELSERTPLFSGRSTTTSYSTGEPARGTPPASQSLITHPEDSPWKSTAILPSHRLSSSYGAL
jgi:Phospholipid-translocating P-type ATPase C-terminal